MKKLLLLIVPMLLLFGVSFGDSLFLGNRNNTSSASLPRYGIQFILTKPIILTGFKAMSTTTCKQYEIYGGYTPSLSMTLLQTGVLLSGQINDIPDIFLTGLGYTYQIVAYSGGVNCAAGYYAISTGRENYAKNTINATVPPFGSFYSYPQGGDGQLNTKVSAIDTLYYSYTPDNIVNIIYNNTSIQFNGSNIYLQDGFYPYTMSGSDIVFRPYIYRALFRSN